MITWVKTGCMEVAALPNGWTATIRTTIDSLCRKPVNVVIYDQQHEFVRDYWATEVAEVKREIEEHYAPKPFDRAEHSSYWRNKDGTRTAYVYASGGYWHAQDHGRLLVGGVAREAAEDAAAKYVRGEG